MLMEFWHSYQPSAVIAQVGLFTVHWYGLMMAVAAVFGYFITKIDWRRRNWNTASLDQLIVLLFICGLVGARLVDVFFYEWWYFKDNLHELIYFWQGGLAWHGGLIGAVPALWWWSKKYHLSFWQLADSLVISLAVGQAIGRWGNYFNQELFGAPTNLPWAIPINFSQRPSGYAVFSHYHPAFLYEFVGLIIIAGLLRYLSKNLQPSGKLFASYLVLVGVLRFALEFIRIDQQNLFWGIRAGLFMAVVTVIIGLLLWGKFSRIGGSYKKV